MHLCGQQVLLIYRPGSEAITTTFFVDLAETLDRVVAYNGPVYIVGDLNVRLDRDDDVNTKQLLELLDVYGFTVASQRSNARPWRSTRCRCNTSR